MMTNRRAFPINRELVFFRWVDSLSDNDKVFFMELYAHRRYRCDFDFTPIRGTISDKLAKSPFCQDMLVSRKKGTVENIIDSMDQNQLRSLFCQVAYGIYLMHRNGWYHFDTKLDNICFSKTTKKYVRIGRFGSIRTYGMIVSIIDYGLVLHHSFEMDEQDTDLYHANKMGNIDLFLLVDYVLMNNMQVYRQIGPHNIGIKPLHVFNIIKQIPPKIYQEIIEFAEKVTTPYIGEFDQFLSNGGTFQECRKIPKYRHVMYCMMHLYQLKYTDDFFGHLTKYYGHDIMATRMLFSTKEIIYIMTYHRQMSKIINYIAQPIMK